MTQRRPECPSCLRRHWEILPTEAAAIHCHMRTARFREAVAKGIGPAPWAHDLYATSRYHVDELDRWMRATTGSVAA